MNDINGLEPVDGVESVDTDADEGTTATCNGERGRSPGATSGPPAPMTTLDGASPYRARSRSLKNIINSKASTPPRPKHKFKKPALLIRARAPKGAPPTRNRRKSLENIHEIAELAFQNVNSHAASPQGAAGQTELPVAGPVASSASPFAFAPRDVAPDDLAAWETIARTYRNDPVGFAIDMLGVTPDEWQAGCMAHVGNGGRLLSVRAGHGVGKSAFCSWLALWHAVVWFPQKTVLTAPTQGQLFKALFAEVKFWLKRLPPFLCDLFEAQAEQIVLKNNTESSFIAATTASKERPEAMAGVHCDMGSVLLIGDEASAIPEEVYESASGSMSGRTAHTVLISNPTRVTGLFYDTHHRLRLRKEKDGAGNLVKTGRWHCVHVSCLDSARADSEFVGQIIDTYGIESNAYRVRVLGEFATREDDVLIPAVLVDAAVKREMALDIGAPLIYGLDVARFGDDRTVLCKRRGGVVIDIKWWSKEDTMATVGRVMNEFKLDKPDEICVDSIGIGAGVADRLRELGLPCKDVNVAESSPMNPAANRLRDDLWLQVRDWLTAGSAKLPDNDRLKQDLKAPTYGFSSGGRIVVESKALMKKRRLPSPDYADALCLTFGGDAAMVGGRMSMWTPGKPLRRNMAGVV